MLTLILSLQQLAGSQDLCKLRADLDAAYAEMQRQARDAGVAEPGVELAGFALLAFADEVVVNAPWGGRVAWPLMQYSYFGTHMAGEQFFDNLSKIRANEDGGAVWSDPARAGLLEIYYLCLLLGFRGKWAFNAPRRVKEALDQIAAQVSLKPLPPLSPDAEPRRHGPQIWRAGLLWILAALAIELAIFAALILLAFYWPGPA